MRKVTAPISPIILRTKKRREEEKLLLVNALKVVWCPMLERARVREAEAALGRPRT
jgi:hypothetical protein